MRMIVNCVGIPPMVLLNPLNNFGSSHFQFDCNFEMWNQWRRYGQNCNIIKMITFSSLSSLLRLYTMGLLNVFSTQQRSCNGGVENDLEERDVESFQPCWILTRRTRVSFLMQRVLHTRRQGAFSLLDAEREVVE
jgi:hypothetical protein